jgi:hypothetical protein
MAEPTQSNPMAEALAAQSLFVGLCHGLMKMNPENVGLVKYAFDYADHVATLGSYKLGGVATGPYLTGFAEILEQLRAATIPDHGEPKGAV